jgi:transcriptional regulator with XRE-family HTH domain
MLDTAKVRQWREARGLNQAQAARRAGFGGGKRRWKKIETGQPPTKRGVSITTVSKVAKALAVRPREILKN